MVIFVLLAVMSYGGLRTVLNAQESFDHHSDRLSDLQMVFVLLTRDIEQAINRPVRDTYGDPVAALLGDLDGIELTRAGWRNPGGLLRSQLQRVAWRLVDRQLSRASWAVLDRGPDTTVVESVMLDDVTSISFRYLSAQGEWSSEWPLPDQKFKDQALPQAVEIKFELEDWGDVTRLFRITTEQAKVNGSQT